MKRKPLVYLAAPYTRGNQTLNVRCQAIIWHTLRADGIVTPLAPLFTIEAERLRPLVYDDWIDHSYDVVCHCDAVLRCNAIEVSVGYEQCDSRGADLEELFARSNGIPVFYSKENLYEWASSVTGLELGHSNEGAITTSTSRMEN